ncbi:MAG: ABC transporter permease [Candidatus Dormibacteria bacterium]
MNLNRVAARLNSLQRRTNLVSVLLVAAILVIAKLVPRTGPGTFALGTAFGAGTGLAVMGVVLVYRSTRIINFAQVQMGTVSGVLFGELVGHKFLSTGLLAICPDCAGQSWVRPVTYWTAAVLCVLVGPVVGFLVFLLLRLLASAPRFVSTVATIAIGSALAALASLVLPRLFDPNSNRALSGFDVTPPVTLTLNIGGTLVGFGQLLAAVGALVALVAVMSFLQLTRAGRAVRATAEDRERASTLGINEGLVQAQVWLLAGTLAALASVLSSIATNGSGGGASAGVLVRVLVAAILAGLESVPLALFGAIALACLDQAFFTGFQNNSLVDGALFAIVLVALLLRPRGAPTRYDADAAVWRVVREARPTPLQLRDLPVIRRWRRGVFLAVAGILVGLPFVTAPGDLEGYSTLVIYAIVGLSLLLVAGWAGQVSLGQFGFVGVGAFVAAVLAGQQHLPMPVALLGAAIVGALVAVVVGLPSLRIRGLYLAVTSLSFALAVSSILISPALGGRYLPERVDRPVVLGLDLEDERAFYYLCVVVATLVAGAVVGMRRSRTGRAVIGSRDNERAAQALGIAPVLARVEIFAVSGFFAALGGGLFAYGQHGVHIGSYSPEVSQQMFLMVVVGGLGSVAGPLLGAAFLAISPLLASVNQAGPQVGQAALVLLLLWQAPGGLSQLVFAGRDAFLRRVADRYHIDVPSLAGRRLGENPRTPIAPRVLRGGGTAFVPVRYRVPGMSRVRRIRVPEPGVRR